VRELWTACAPGAVVGGCFGAHAVHAPSPPRGAARDRRRARRRVDAVLLGWAGTCCVGPRAASKRAALACYVQLAWMAPFWGAAPNWRCYALNDTWGRVHVGPVASGYSGG
jgi:hypothetical protein